MSKLLLSVSWTGRFKVIIVGCWWLANSLWQSEALVPGHSHHVHTFCPRLIFGRDRSSSSSLNLFSQPKKDMLSTTKVIGRKRDHRSFLSGRKDSVYGGRRPSKAIYVKNNQDDSYLRSSFDPVKDKLDAVKEKWDTTVIALQERMDVWLQDFVPKPVLDFVKWFVEKIYSWRLLFVGFSVGIAFALAAILVPVYNTVETLSQPVTLFETILGDLEEAYVDPVDTTKLFETGISAMLRSLDPYTEFESRQAAADLTESIDGRYAGVGLVISGTPQRARGSTTVVPSTASKLMPKKALEENIKLQDGNNILNTPGTPITEVSQEAIRNAADASANENHDGDFDADLAQVQRERAQELEKARRQGIRVVSAFEGYAFDYGMRVGDKIVAIDDQVLSLDTTVEQVRNTLRGEPGTLVSISFERDGVEGVQKVTMPRTVVRMRDVKLATLLGRPDDGIGYIQLTGFASNAGQEMRNAIRYLQQAAEDASDGERSLQGLVLDLRNNPGGLLTSAVDVASLIVPKDSDIVSAKGRGFPGILYRSRVDPILDPNTRLAVLVNGGTASAAEIVSGAVQDLDVGIIVGADRTFGKGLVQNVEDLPFNTALKFTVAKYYTPSGRCIQGINYREGGGLKEEDSQYTASKVADKDRSVFHTKNGRVVRDGGGIEADFKVNAPKASALEITLLRSGVFSEFASEWSKNNELTHSFKVDEDTYKQFQSFVSQREKAGELSFEELYSRPLEELKKALKQSGYTGSERGVEELQANIVREVQKDFEKYRTDIKEDISQSILARYLPESMLIERGVKADKQVDAAVKLLTNGKSKFDRILAREQHLNDWNDSVSHQSGVSVASNNAHKEVDQINHIRTGLRW